MSLSASFLDSKNAGFLYKSKVFAGILSKKAFVGPYVVVIGGKYNCNYKCVFCEWFSSIGKKLGEEINADCYVNLDVYRNVVRELRGLGTKIILIDYLEPFTDSDLIEKIEIAKQTNLKCIVITNGSLIDEQNAEKLVNLKLDYLNISINAGKAETYPLIHLTETEQTFERIVSMIKLIQKLKKQKRTIFPQIRLSIVVCNRNYQEIERFVELCNETGVKNALIKKMVPTSKEIADELDLTCEQEKEIKENLAQALKTAKKHKINVDIEWGDSLDSKNAQNLPCYYGWLFSFVDVSGYVHPCCFQDRDPNCSMGNIREDSFTNLWFSEKYRDFRKNYRSIDKRRKMGCQCNHPSCFSNNQQIYKILHESYLLPITYGK